MKRYDSTALKLRLRVCVIPCMLLYVFFQTEKKADNFQSVLQVEFDGTVLGESDKKQADSVRKCVDYNFTCSFRCARDAQSLSNMAQKPVICKPSFKCYSGR